MPPSSPSRLRRLCAATLLIGASTASAAAQTFLTRNYTAEDGLPASEVFDARRDPAGRLWVATRSGVAIYDGTDWERVVAPNGTQLRDILGIRFDPQGRAWLVRVDQQVFVASADAVVALPSVAAGRPEPRLLDLELLPDPAGTRFAVASYANELHLWDGSAWSRAAAVDASLGALRAIERHGEGMLVGTVDGLWRLDREGRQATPVPLPPGSAPSICGLLLDTTLGRERVWIQGADWIGSLTDHGIQVVRTGVPAEIEPLAGPMILAPDGFGGLYVGNGFSLHHVDGEGRQLTRLGRRNGLVGEGVSSLSLDDEGLLWVATRLGVSKLVSQRWASYFARDGMLSSETSALLELPDGRLLLGHNEGLSVMGPAGLVTLPLEGHRDDLPGRTRVLDLDLDDDGNAWIASSSIGLGRLGPGSVLEWIPLPAMPDGSPRWANAVHCDRRGRVWVGSSFGLLRLEGRELVVAAPGALDQQYIRRVAEASDGRLLLACDRGIWIGERDEWRQVLPVDEDISSGMYALSCDPDGRVWVGGRSGLWTLEGVALVRPASGPVVEGAVYSLLRDRQERLWIGTDHGVLRWDGEVLEHFTVHDGLAGNETNRAAALVDRDGDVWFGTDRGLSVFRSRYDRAGAAPRLEPLELVVDGVLHDPARATRLGPRRSLLTFRARTRSLVDEVRLGWRARLEGFETEWREATGGTCLESRYPALPAGAYRFVVQARQGEGPWSATLASAEVTITGPFWTRWWFFTLAVAATAGLGAGGYRLVAQRRYARRLEDEIARRSAELEATQLELARGERLRSLGVLAGGIAHDFNNVLTVLMGNISLLRSRSDGRAPQDPLLDDCDKALQRAQQLSSQLLTFAKGGEPVTRSVSLAQLVEDSLRLALAGSSVRSEVDLPEDLWPIRADPAQVCQALENLMINARQAMPAGGVVRVRARNVGIATDDGAARTARFVRIELSDQGAGIPADVLPHVFEPFFTTKERGSGLGLATAHSVVRRHGGSLEVDSPPGAGATFTLHLPAAEAAPEPMVQEPAPRAATPRVRQVLVMDDEPFVRTLLEQMLASLGCRVVVSASGEEALRALSAAHEAGQRFTCAILDLTVPGGLGGREVLPRLRELDPDLRAIATSGYAEDAVLARPGQFGFQGALAKPFRVADVSAALDALG